MKSAFGLNLGTLIGIFHENIVLNKLDVMTEILKRHKGGDSGSQIMFLNKIPFIITTS